MKTIADLVAVVYNFNLPLSLRVDAAKAVATKMLEWVSEGEKV